MKIRRVKAGETVGFPAPSVCKGSGWVSHTATEPGFIVVLSQAEAASGGVFVSDATLKAVKARNKPCAF